MIPKTEVAKKTIEKLKIERLVAQSGKKKYSCVVLGPGIGNEGGHSRRVAMNTCLGEMGHLSCFPEMVTPEDASKLLDQTGQKI